METQKGCKFCRRHGLPVLPIRPAIMAIDDLLPHLPDSIYMPVNAQGDIAWTGRLLRAGFLYIWAESGRRWINYFITPEGYYYPLPENGDVPNDIASGKVKPCIEQPAELACASLITLPVKPAGMKNGAFWFCWSEIEWTPAVREKHQDAAYRRQYMQSFDMDAWITGGQAGQAITINALGDTVAEYSPTAGSSTIKRWSSAPWKAVRPQEGGDLQQAANTLYPGKGAMIVLQDPPAILQDLSGIINYELQQKVYQKAEYQRELALASAITGLKAAMIRQFERDYLERSESEERNALYGPFGYTAHSEPPDNRYTAIGDRGMKFAVASKWAEYEQYYDPVALADFQTTFNKNLKQYNDRIITPRTAMYLEWMKSDTFLSYLAHNFDPDELKDGIDYVHTINYCIAGMQDKVAVFRYFSDLLSGGGGDVTNILARALVLNQDELEDKLTRATAGFSDWVTLPWHVIADAFKLHIEKMRDNAAGVVGVLIGLLSGNLVRKITQALESNRVYRCLVAIGAITNKALVPFEKTGTYKEFVTEVVTQLAKESGFDSRANKDTLRHYVRRELRRLKIDGLPMEVNQTKKFLVMVDIDKVHGLTGMESKMRAIAVSRLLQTAAEVEAQQFIRWQGAVLRGVRTSGNSAPFILGIFSGILQAASLYHSADLDNKKTLTADQQEAHARFVAGVFALGNTIFNIIESGIKNFLSVTGIVSSQHIFNARRGVRVFGYVGKVLGIMASGVSVWYDIYHMTDNIYIGHIGLAIAYGTTVMAGILLIVTGAYIASGAITFIIVALLIGVAVYLAFNERNNIQKWLVQCLWRRIPTDPNDSLENQEKYRRREAADLPVWPTMEMEMAELQLALNSRG